METVLVHRDKGLGTMDLMTQMDKIYREMLPDEIPWNLEEPPDILVALIASQQILPCRAVDLGCGAGNYTVWMAARGFEMTGIDISPKAVALARELAESKGVQCRFISADITGDFSLFDPSFDFAYDWALLHHVFPEKRARYAANVHRLLRPGGRYLSVCFSEDDESFGGEGKYRTTPLGTQLYFSSEKEVRALFEPFFHIEAVSTEEIRGKEGFHRAIKALMKKK
jgi:SAM-dependent methyltransferase